MSVASMERSARFGCATHKKLALNNTVFQTSINVADQGFDFGGRSFLASGGYLKHTDYYFGNSMISVGYDKDNKNLIVAEERLCNKAQPNWLTGTSVHASWEHVKTAPPVDASANGLNYLEFSIPSNTSNVIVKNMIISDMSFSGGPGIVVSVCGQIYDETDKCEKGFIFTFSLISGKKAVFFDSGTSPWYLYTNANTNTNTSPAQRLDCGINMLYNITIKNRWTFIYAGYEDIVDSGIKRKGIVGILGVAAYGINGDFVTNPTLRTIYPGDDSTGTNDNNDTDVVYIGTANHNGSKNLEDGSVNHNSPDNVMVIMNVAERSPQTPLPTLATQLTLNSQSSRSIQARRFTVTYAPSNFVDIEVETPTMPIFNITPSTVTTNHFKSIQYTCSTTANTTSTLVTPGIPFPAYKSRAMTGLYIFATIYQISTATDLEIYGGIFSVDFSGNDSGLGVSFPTGTGGSTDFNECTRIYPLKTGSDEGIDNSTNLIPRTIAFISAAESLKYTTSNLTGLFLSFDVVSSVDVYSTNITTIVFGESLNLFHAKVPFFNGVIHPFNDQIQKGAVHPDCEFFWSFTTITGGFSGYNYIRTSMGQENFTEFPGQLNEYRYNIQIMCDTVYLFGFGSIINSPPVASHTFGALLNAISNICLSKGTQILCDQGIINIEKINTRKHTINNRTINHITQSIHTDDYLIKIKKNCLSSNSPSSDIICSGDHKILYKNKLIEAKKLINLVCGVEKIKNDKRVLYNILMDKHEVIMANNTRVESLHPQNIIAQFYNNYNNPQAREFLSDKIGQNNRYNIHINKINKNKLNGLLVGNKISKKMSLKL